MLSARCLLILIYLFLSGCICPKTSVCFTPDGNCTEQIVNSVDKAQRSIFVQAYEFTSKPIAKSLIKAKSRGIDIKVILDESQTSSKYSVINELFKQKIPIWIDYKPTIAHSKIMIIDSETIVTGSFNFTYSAQKRNAENLLIISKNRSLVDQYSKNWHERHMQSRLYQPAEE